MSAEVRERGLACGELDHAFEGLVPAHTHKASFYHLVLDGSCEESSPHGRIFYQPFSCAFTHSDSKHDGRIHGGRARLFTVEIGDAWIKELREMRPEPETVSDCRGGELTCHGIELYREYRKGPTACALTVDSLIWEVLAAAARFQVRESGAPRWWSRMLDRVHSDFQRDLRISELAREADVHPVYLARVFRRRYRQTPGEYVQRLRVRFASEWLSLSDDGIAGIAAEAGFADQSHLTRIFKRYARMSPGEFRQAFTTRRKWESAGQLRY
jgi:AraC family transcriptional regulator